MSAIELCRRRFPALLHHGDRRLNRTHFLRLIAVATSQRAEADATCGRFAIAADPDPRRNTQPRKPFPHQNLTHVDETARTEAGNLVFLNALRNGYRSLASA